MSNKKFKDGKRLLENKIIDFKELRLLKKKKDTAEIVRIVAQQICEDCIDEYHKIKSRLDG